MLNTVICTVCSEVQCDHNNQLDSQFSLSKKEDANYLCEVRKRERAGGGQRKIERERQTDSVCGLLSLEGIT